MLSTCTDCVPNFQAFEYLPWDELEMQKSPSSVAGEKYSLESPSIIGFQVLTCWRTKSEQCSCAGEGMFEEIGGTWCYTRHQKSFYTMLEDVLLPRKQFCSSCLCTVSPLLGNNHILLMSPAKWRDSRAEVHPLCCVLLKRYLPTFIHGSAGPVYYLCVRFACTFPPNSSALHTDLYVNIFLNCSGSSHDFWQLHGKEGSS